MTKYQTIQCSAHHMPKIPDASVQCIATSPPYFGLRSYDGDQAIEWPTVEYAPMPGLPAIRIQGCEPRCVHEWADGPILKQTGGGVKNSTLGEKSGGGKISPQGHINSLERSRFETTQGAYCIHCGGWRGGLGLESDPFAYIGHLILCLREWRRVLHPTGLVWCNLGDSYANDGKWGGSTGGKHVDSLHGQDGPGRIKRQTGLKPKDLMQIPQRFALAAQADGWYLRSAMPWLKRNGMPESVTDRPAQTIESVFILTKNERYFWDAVAVDQPVSNGTHGGAWNEGGEKQAKLGQQRGGMLGNSPLAGRRNFRSSDLFFKTWQGLLTNDEGDPLALVINPQPYSASHFAVFPPLLPEIAVKSSTSEKGCCAACGAPWVRVVELGEVQSTGGSPNSRRNGHTDFKGSDMNCGVFVQRAHITTGWQPSCTCTEIPGHPSVEVPFEPGGDTGYWAPAPIPCTVLDPFAGSGTTLQVAVRLGRRAIGVDLSTTYLMSLVPERMDEVSTEPKRLNGHVADYADSPLFAELAQ